MSDVELERLVEASCGHPYMLQLLGYFLVATVNASGGIGPHEVSSDEVSEAIGLAADAYKERALRPLVTELKPDERRYLQALADVLDAERTGATSDVARVLGVGASRASYVRRVLLDHGIVISAGYGKLMFNIPYLANYLRDEEAGSTQLERAREWRL